MELPINIDAKAVEAIGRKYRAKTLSLFGSVLTDRFRADSDVNMLVEFGPEDTPTYFDLMGMQEELADLLGRKVDLRTVNEIRPQFRDELVKNAVVQYAT